MDLASISPGAVVSLSEKNPSRSINHSSLFPWCRRYQSPNEIITVISLMYRGTGSNGFLHVIAMMSDGVFETWLDNDDTVIFHETESEN